MSGDDQPPTLEAGQLDDDPDAGDALTIIAETGEITRPPLAYELEDPTAGDQETIELRSRRMKPGRITVAAVVASVVVAAVAGAVAFLSLRGDRAPAPTPTSAAPRSQAPPMDFRDAAVISVLKQQGIPVPNDQYVIDRVSELCKYMARPEHPNFANGVHHIQEMSVWDQTQSALFAGAATASHCPQYQPVTPSPAPSKTEAVPSVAAPAPQAQPSDSNQDGLMQWLAQNQVSVADPRAAVAAAQFVCGRFGQGATRNELIESVKKDNPEITPLGASVFVSGAVAFYCPQYATR